LSGFYSSLDVAADDGAVSLPVSDQGSNAYTDVNTLLEQHAGRRPDKIVVESPDQDARITYGELEALTRRFANFLADEGVRPGDRISLLSDNGIEPLIVFWGALRAGVIVNPVNVEIREKHVSQILHDVAPTAVFWSRELPGDPRALATGGAPWIPFGRWNAPSAPADDLFANPRHPYTLGLLQSVPRLDAARRARLHPIEGAPPNMLRPPAACPFQPRCRYEVELSRLEVPPLVEITRDHWVACFNPVPADEWQRELAAIS